MFTVSNDKKINQLGITKIVKNINLVDFLNEVYSYSDNILCPSHAIDISNASIIQNKCISCGLCWLLTNDVISFDQNYNENDFMDFCKKNKMFLYAWLTLVLKECSGIEISSSGYSRTKRIPLIVSEKPHLIHIISVCLSSKNIEKAYAEIDDTIDLSKTELRSYSIKKIIIIVDFDEEYLTFLNNFQDCIFLDAKKVLKSVLLNNCRSISKLINLSEC